MSTPSEQERVGFTCDMHLTNGNIPPEAYHINLDSGNDSKELSDLNSLEQHLLACELPPQKLCHFSGQRGIHGLVVCVKKITTSFPRGIHGCHLIKVKLKRKLQYRCHYQFQLITKVKMALQYLKHHTYLDHVICRVIYMTTGACPIHNYPAPVLGYGRVNHILVGCLQVAYYCQLLFFCRVRWWHRSSECVLNTF